jgi:hypothetical protein
MNSPEIETRRTVGGSVIGSRVKTPLDLLPERDLSFGPFEVISARRSKLHINKHSVLSLALICLSLLGTAAPAQVSSTSDALTYQGAVLEPGDVITLHQGAVTKMTAHVLVYGHTALYLGRNERTGEAEFLDFTTSKGREPYYGRILGETDFLEMNAKNHPSFDVYRLLGFLR